MDKKPLYQFKLPPEEDVIRRNRTITAYYAKMYRSEPKLYKWAGMAAFASFHIGEKLKLWNWHKSGIKTFSETCQKKNRNIEDDFQIIRIINNRIFMEIGSLHLAFSQLDYSLFKEQLIESKKHKIIIEAFEKLQKVKKDNYAKKSEELVWEANVEILYHEQSLVVQPMFNKLTSTFSSAMSLIASFDYTVNHKKTNWKLNSRFISFMLTKGFWVTKKQGYLPNVTNFKQRWFWITEDLLKKWQQIENKTNSVDEEIDYLLSFDNRAFIMNTKKMDKTPEH
ncbi:DUF2515 family protein [Gilvibacter sediminis]|uniref:DUF2515 family protein n=1 Tax=Gilvibacter sediminis TaxID=379071 RepID=UPI00234FB6D0|nr:hypothetical protein [Gilvibacter sediminis]MDC7998662.1 hypothetical protein [Gilvibacter sediminis]